MKLIFYIVIILLLFSYVFFKEKGIKDYIELTNKYSQVLEENNKLKTKNKELELMLKKLKTDKNYIESIAREKYNMLKKDEILIKIEKKGDEK